MIPRNISQERCLICCEDQTLSVQLSRILTTFGYSVDTVSSRSAAIRSFVEKHHHLLVIEASFLPRFSHRIVQLFKMAHRTPATIIVGDEMTDVLSYLYLKEGVYEFVKKPYRIEDLALSIKKVTEQHSLVKKNLFLKDLVMHVALTVPVIMLLVWLAARF